MPYEKKLDFRIVGRYFVGYSKKPRAYKFYDSSTLSFFKTNNVKFIEDVERNGSDNIIKVVFEGVC